VSDVWSTFTHDPRTARHAPLRAADADREVVRGVLAAAYADGRLDREELDERQDRLAATRTLGDLPGLIADLVPDTAGAAPDHPAAGGSPVRPTSSLARADDAELHRRAEQTWAEDRRSALVGFLAPTLICWVIWLVIAGGAGLTFPWPAIVTAATAIPVLRLTLAKGAHVSEEVRRLEKRRAKAQAAERELPRSPEPPPEEP